MNASTRFELRVVPGARQPGVVGRHGSAWKVRVSAAPEDGRANQALLGLLAETLSLPRKAVSIVAGHGCRDKIVLCEGLSVDEVETRLSSAVRGTA
jgi:uncharacterized protein YggU (UPF0235/DUF167 family)